MGTFKKSFLAAFLASIGVILSAAYMLWLYRRVIFGKLEKSNLISMSDLNKSEMLILWILAIPILVFGFYPEPLFNTITQSVTNFLDMYNSNIEIYLANKE